MNHRRRPADLTHRFHADSVGRALGLIGDHWTLMILREALFGVRRYGQLARNLGIPRPTLSARLRSLVDSGLVERVRYASDPDRYEYRLTAAGGDLFPAAVLLMRAAPPPLRGARRCHAHLREVRPGDHGPQRQPRARTGVPRRAGQWRSTLHARATVIPSVNPHARTGDGDW
jgi:DNA-binding HxlR family transcriptional regulator